MSLLGFDAIGRLALGQLPGGATALVPVLSDPPQAQPQLRGFRDRGYLIAMAASGEFREILPIIPFQPSWFEGLSEPVRNKARSPAALSPYIFLQPAPSPFVATGWYANLSDPVRIKRGENAALQQFFTTDTTVIPLQRTTPWFAPFREPVRIKPGLRASLQQFLAAPSRLLPNPNLTGIMAAQETPDRMFAAGSIFNRATSAEIGIVDTSFPAAEIGVAAPRVASVRISIRIV